MNKKEYQDNRAKGLRGQGAVPKTTKRNEDKSKVRTSYKAHRVLVPHDPLKTKAYINRKPKFTVEHVLRVKEIRHIYSLVRKGLFK